MVRCVDAEERLGEPEGAGMPRGPETEDGLCEGMLEGNLLELARRAPATFARLPRHLPARFERVGGRWARRFRRGFAPIEESRDDLLGAVAILPGAPDARAQLLLGIGSGERARLLVDQLEEDETLLVHDEDGGGVLLALARFDFRAAIAGGRLRFLIGSELRRTPLPRLRRVLLHPHLEPWTEGDRAFARTAMTLQEDLGAPPPLPSGRGLAVVEGELLAREIAEALAALGKDVAALDLEAFRDRPDALAEEIAALAPEGVLAVNFDAELAQACARADVPLMAWEIDPTTEPIAAATPEAARHAHVFTWRAARVAELHARGWSLAEHLPIGADPALRAPVAPGVASDEHPRFLPLFVGSCMRAAADRLDTRLEAAIAADAPRTEAWRAYMSRRDALIAALIRDPFAHDVAAELECARTELDLPSVVATPDGPAELAVLAGERLASERRVAVVRALLPEGLAVAGEADWAALVPAGAYVGEAAYGGPLTGLYRRSGLIVDLDRAYQPDITTLRVFEASATGALVLARRTAELERLFDLETEVAAWDTLDELKGLIRRFRAAPEEARARGLAARDRVLREHTVTQRVARMLARAAERRTI